MSTRLNQQLHPHHRLLEAQDRDQEQGQVSSERRVEVGSDEQREEAIRIIKVGTCIIIWNRHYVHSMGCSILICMRHITISEIGLRIIRLGGKERAHTSFAPPLVPCRPLRTGHRLEGVEGQFCESFVVSPPIQHSLLFPLVLATLSSPQEEDREGRKRRAYLPRNGTTTSTIALPGRH